jgi:hypothetical protein
MTLHHILVRRRKVMKTLLAIATLAATIALAPVGAVAQERIGDGAMGVGAGLLAGGPVGAVVGGVIGYTAGPNIAQAMGLRYHHYRHYADRDRHNGDEAR